MLKNIVLSAHDVRTTLYRRCFNVLTSYQRPYNVVLIPLYMLILFSFFLGMALVDLLVRHTILRRNCLITAMQSKSKYLTV